MVAVAARLLAIFCILGSSLSARAASPEVACDCPKLECDSCHEEQGVTFYSEKCGPNFSKVKSCARPTCIPIENLPKQCEYVKAGKTDGVIVAGTGKPAPAPRPLDAKTPPELVAAPTEQRGAIVAKAAHVKGQAWLKAPEGSKNLLVAGTDVHEKDLIITDKGAEVQIEFKDGNVSNIQPESKMKIQQYDEAEKKDKRAILDLIHGKVRNQVKQKYDGKSSSFQVRTRAAVAGVRGTDFVVSYKPTAGEKLEAKVETIEGVVVFGGREDEEVVEVKAGEGVSFLVAENDSSVFDEDEIGEFIARGYMTPVYKLSKSDLKKLDSDTNFGLVARKTASQEANKVVCQEPKGKFNQCLWVCENNPKGEKKCRTDLPQVNCVRKRCDAEGVWSDDSRLPASYQESCKPEGYKVGPCDY